MVLKKYIILFVSLFILTACNNDETISLEEHENLQAENKELKEDNDKLRTEVTNLENKIGNLNSELADKDEETEESFDFKEASKQAKKEKVKSTPTKKKTEENTNEKSEEEATATTEKELSISKEELKEQIENILQEAGRPMNASISEGVEGNFITLEGRARDGLSDSHIGQRVKEGMARILIAFHENDVDFEEVRISFYLPTVDAHGKEGQSNMALGVFDKETVDKLEPENEFYISESIESIAIEFELDSQFIE